MKYRDWRDKDIEHLWRWEDEDPRCTEPFKMVAKGFKLTNDALDQMIPERGVVLQGKAVVGIVGMKVFGDTADVHIVVNPTRRSFLVSSRVYDLGLEEARRRGVRWAVGTIPTENKPAQMMAIRKGFKPIPAVVMVKEL